MSDVKTIPPTVLGVARDADNPCSISVAFAFSLTDAQLRAFHTYVREWDGEVNEVFIRITPNPDLCAHEFEGWRPFHDGNGGEQVCTKCGIGAMAHTLRTGI